MKESDANVAITVGLISGKLRSEVELRLYTAKSVNSAETDAIGMPLYVRNLF